MEKTILVFATMISALFACSSIKENEARILLAYNPRE